MERTNNRRFKRGFYERLALVFFLVGVAAALGAWQRSWAIFLVVLALLVVYAIAELIYWAIVARLVGRA